MTLPSDSQSIEQATTSIQAQPDNKTRRYDRQLRLWAATGQSALESSRVLVLSASATSTSILKNLVLPGIGHFTVLDPHPVSPADAGNNFFLNGPASIGKSRAAEVVPLLRELNDSVEGAVDTRSVEEVIKNGPAFITGHSLIIAHNLEPSVLELLSTLLWSDPSAPPLIVVRSAGFLAEFFIQFHEQDIIESHTDTAPSLRIDSPFPALLEHAVSLDLDNMDPTDHGHVPYVVILVRALEDWKKLHNGLPPQTYAEKQAFKDLIGHMKCKPDEENFDEALAQAYRAYTQSKLPSHLPPLFAALPSPLLPSAPPFHHLLSALKTFTEKTGHLPLTSSLPDMKADTERYVALQKMYRAAAQEDRDLFKALLDPAANIEDDVVDLFVKNAHGVQLLHGAPWGALDRDPVRLASLLESNPRETATHLALSALAAWSAEHPQSTNASSANAVLPSAEELLTTIRALIGQDVVLPEKEIDDAVGEAARAPTADLPNVAAFLGGLVAQEAIKMITKQYVPVNGYCIVDLVDTWTGVIA